MNGCIDDSDNDGIGDNLDLCETFVLDNDYPVDEFGCRPIDSPLTISDPDVIGWLKDFGRILRSAVGNYDEDLDPYLTGARIMINQTAITHSSLYQLCWREVIAENGFTNVYGIYQVIYLFLTSLVIAFMCNFSLKV